MGLFFAWSVGEGIITWRWIKNHAPPTPGALLLPTALYLSLAILSEYRPARATATVFAWSVNLAILLQVVGKAPAQATGWPPPKMLPTQIWPGGASAPAAAASSKAQTPAAKAESGASISSQIIKDLTELPGLGIIK
jgi:hypothetical protein